MKFKGSGRFQNVTLLGDDHVLNTFYLGTSSSSSDDVEWFTGKMVDFQFSTYFGGLFRYHSNGKSRSNLRRYTLVFVLIK